MKNLDRFSGKVVVVTGASRGIGEGIAKRFAQEGASVVVSADEPRVEQVAEAILSAGGKAMPVICDVTDKASVESLYAQTAQHFGRVDVSVQNAGVITIARLPELSEEQWDKVMAVNTKGVFLCCQAAVRYMMSQGSGRLINTASGQARQGFIYTPHYAASKMGVVGITQSLAKEVAKEGITVNAFCPGIIDTDIHASGGEPGRASRLAGSLPMKRPGRAEEVAEAILWLLSDAASYTTGTIVDVAGGR